MTKFCIVPNCKTRYSNSKIKRSIFRVPRNEELRKKWEAATPGLNSLRDNQFICERHFKVEDILRSYFKKEPNGRVISELPYHHPRLAEGAIPSIFHDDEELNEDQCRENQSAATSLRLSDVRTAIKTKRKTVTPSLADSCIITTDAMKNTSAKNPSSAKAEENAIIIKTDDNYDDESEALSPASSSDDNCYESCFRLSNLTFHEKVYKLYDTNDAHKVVNQKNSINIPSNWSVVNAPIDGIDYFIFSMTKMMKRNDEHFPTTFKHMTLDSDRNLTYFIYERPIDPIHLNVTPILTDIDILPDILTVFGQKMTCSGIVEFDYEKMDLSKLFTDNLGQWHSNGCTLVSSRVRCEPCTTWRYQSQTELKITRKVIVEKNLNLTNQLLNPQNQTKLVITAERDISQKLEFIPKKTKINMTNESVERKENKAAIDNQRLD